MGGMCGYKTRQAHFPQQQQQEQEQQEHEEEHVRSQEGWSSRSGDRTARQAHPMKSTEDSDPESFTGPSKPYSSSRCLLRASRKQQQAKRRPEQVPQYTAISHQQFSNHTDVELTHGDQPQPTTTSFVLVKTGGIDFETRNSRRQSPTHISHPGESIQIHSVDYRLPIL